jgi:hypothetical protein
LGWEPTEEAGLDAVPEPADRPWRGVFGDLTAPAAVTLPPEPVLPPARPNVPNLNWLPDRGGEDE